MKISYLWLKDFVAFDESPSDIARMLTFLGIEATVPSAAGATWKNVITAKVLDVQKHPNADKLSLCSLTDGQSTFSVVCGAPNVAAGQVVPLALIGAELPGGLKIGKAKIRGVESQGMICSERELGLREESAGIMVLPDSIAPGKPLAEALSGGDTTIEVEIPTNRPDALSHAGIAREIAAKLRKPVTFPDTKQKSIPADVNVTILESELCPRYTGAIIENVTVAPSPAWMAQRLEKCGLRPINNIVDITNYVLLEMGHPLHAFDLDKLDGKALTVRRAQPGEKFNALDGKEYPLADSMLVIADNSRAQAVAGIIGGADSGVSQSTRSILLESALFAPYSVRRTSKTLGISTDSSYRFERGCSWDSAELAGWRAINLIEELSGGTLRARKDVTTKTFVPVNITLRPARAAHLLDVPFTSKEAESILSLLGCKVTPAGDAISVDVPSWRLDLKQETDLLEELIRIKGYEHVPTAVMPVMPDIREGKKAESAENIARARLASLGFSEAVNYSFSEKKSLEFFSLEPAHLIANPLSKENEALRPSLLPGLWKNFILNSGKGNERILLFETGTIFTKAGERKSLAILACGNVWEQWWAWKNNSAPRTYDYYFIKGIIESIFCDGNKFTVTENSAPSAYFHPGQSARLEANGTMLGEFGMLRPEYNATVAFAEFDISAIEQNWNRQPPLYESLDRFPPVKRDLSILAPKNIAFSKISATVSASVPPAKNITLSCRLDDIYEDDQKLGADKRSYTMNLTFHPATHTLTDQEAGQLLDGIIADLQKLSISLRA